MVGGGGGGGWWCLKPSLVFCFGPNLKLWFFPRPKLNKIYLENPELLRIYKVVKFQCDLHRKLILESDKVESMYFF